MEPIIREENKIYAVGYSYEADWRKLCRVKDRAAYWSRIDFSNMEKAAYGGIENKCGMEIAFWLCKETGDFEMRFFFGERVEPVGNVPDGMEVLEIPAAKYAIFTLDSQGDTLSQDAYIQAIKDLWQYNPHPAPAVQTGCPTDPSEGQADGTNLRDEPAECQDKIQGDRCSAG